MKLLILLSILRVQGRSGKAAPQPSRGADKRAGWVDFPEGCLVPARMKSAT